MAPVVLRFSALPTHVRTARLVAVAVARLAGVDESVLDGVRLAVGEACSWAVGLQARRAAPRPVRVTMVRQETRFVVEVGGDPAPVVADQGVAEVPAPTGTDGLETVDEAMGLAVIKSLAGDLVIGHGEDGGSFLRVSWPVARPSDDPR